MKYILQKYVKSYKVYLIKSYKVYLYRFISKFIHTFPSLPSKIRLCMISALKKNINNSSLGRKNQFQNFHPKYLYSKSVSPTYMSHLKKLIIFNCWFRISIKSGVQNRYKRIKISVMRKLLMPETLYVYQVEIR